MTKNENLKACDIIAPKEPTQEMLLHGLNALDCTHTTIENRLSNIAEMYKAMTENCEETRPTLTPASVCMEKTVPEEFDAICDSSTDGDAERALNDLKNGCIGSAERREELFNIIHTALKNHTATDGDADKAFDCLLEYLQASACGKIAMKYDKFNPNDAVKTIRTALQSTRKPPVDTINIKRKVLQGVSNILQRYRQLLSTVMHTSRNVKSSVISDKDQAESIADLERDIAEIDEVIVSLDAVLSEGE